MNNTNQLIKNNFNNAADKYLDLAKIQIEPALKIIERLEEYYQDGLILDLGSGPGTLTRQAKIDYPEVLFDLSIRMLKSTPQMKPKVNGDATTLPFANNSFSGVISNLMIQWASNKQRVLDEVYRVLKPNGYVIFTTLIKPSLYELQTAWKMVDDDTHTLEFDTQDKYQQYILSAGFTILKSEAWSTTIYFTNLEELFGHFKNTGTNLAKSTSNKGIGGKQALNKLADAYNKQMSDKGLPLTYTYLLIIAIKENLK